MKYSTFILMLASLLTSQLANADWFFRGTANNWSSSAMTVVNSNQMTTCQTFLTTGGTQRFKIDRLGTWSESYPANDYVVNANTSYKIDFVISTKIISVQAVASCTASSSSSVRSSSSLANSSAHSSVSSADAWYFRGTPNNWAATAMSLQLGLYCSQQTFGAASTSPRFKIDHFANWAENYPTGDYTVMANTTYKICFNASTNAITATTIATSSSSSSVGASVASSVASSSRSSTSVASSASSSSISTGVLSDFRKETIYFLPTARFYDGDASNNYYNRDRYKAGDPHWRGDFKGLISKLDYIKDLGFTAIWVTPPIENRSGLDYHGYHAYDFYRVDPRLESVDVNYKTFIDAAHAKGLKVIQDVVINHSSQYGLRNAAWIDRLPIKYYVPAGSTQGNAVNGPLYREFRRL